MICYWILVSARLPELGNYLVLFRGVLGRYRATVPGAVQESVPSIRFLRPFLLWAAEYNFMPAHAHLETSDSPVLSTPVAFPIIPASSSSKGFDPAQRHISPFPFFRVPVSAFALGAASAVMVTPRPSAHTHFAGIRVLSTVTAHRYA